MIVQQNGKHQRDDCDDNKGSLPVFCIRIYCETPSTVRAYSEILEETLMTKPPNTNLNVAMRTYLHQKYTQCCCQQGSPRQRDPSCLIACAAPPWPTAQRIDMDHCRFLGLRPRRRPVKASTPQNISSWLKTPQCDRYGKPTHHDPDVQFKNRASIYNNAKKVADICRPSMRLVMYSS